MDSHQLVNQNSGQVEWYTPPPILAAARRTMGGIDLDPASTADANEAVGATTFYTAAEDGLSVPWFGRVWLNPPFNRAAGFVHKLAVEYAAGRVREACCITFASLDTAWARVLADYPRWYPAGRVDYVAGGGQEAGSPPKASMVTYFGSHVEQFVQVFTVMGGWVDVPWAWHERQRRAHEARWLIRQSAARQGVAS